VVAVAIPGPDRCDDAAPESGSGKGNADQAFHEALHERYAASTRDPRFWLEKNALEMLQRHLKNFAGPLAKGVLINSKMTSSLNRRTLS
jgi:hypothetical protein